MMIALPTKSTQRKKTCLFPESDLSSTKKLLFGLKNLFKNFLKLAFGFQI
jgi:hypothetical protein